jgi:Tat protein secretion system quality control protein TatD with DNase activity
MSDQDESLNDKLSLFLKTKRIEWHQENPDIRMTARAFSVWLGIPEQTFSDLVLASRTPTITQVQKIAKHYPEVYDAIGKPSWRVEKRTDQDERVYKQLLENIEALNPKEMKVILSICNLLLSYRNK